MQRGLRTGGLCRGELEDQEMGSDPGLYQVDKGAYSRDPFSM